MTRPTPRPIVLASTSPGRRAVLARLGLAFDACAPDFDESVLPDGLAPEAIARAFAEGKARGVRALPAGALVIGADQVLEHAGAIVRKTTSLDDAIDQLARLSGSTHLLHAGLALLDTTTGALRSEVVTVRLRMPAHPRAAIEAYVARERPVGSAGGYFYEGGGVALFESVEGGDDSAIVGLPLVPLCRLLRASGVEPLV
jgi:septum formation protein